MPSTALPISKVPQYSACSRAISAKTGSAQESGHTCAGFHTQWRTWKISWPHWPRARGVRISFPGFAALSISPASRWSRQNPNAGLTAFRSGLHSRATCQSVPGVTRRAAGSCRSVCATEIRLAVASCAPCSLNQQPAFRCSRQAARLLSCPTPTAPATTALASTTMAGARS